MVSSKTSALIILSPGFPADEKDTNCLTAQQVLLNSIRKEFPLIEIIVIAFQYPFSRLAYTWKGIDVIPLNGKNKGGLKRLATWINAFRILRRLRKRKEVVGVLSFWCTEAALVGSWFSRIFSLPHFCWILGQDARKENVFVKFIRPLPNELLAISEFVKEEFVRSHRIRPGHLLLNAVDTSRFGSFPNKRKIDILGVGSLIPLKRFDIFIDVIRELVKLKPDVKAIICGKGPEEDNLRRMIHLAGLERNIELAGEIPHEEVLRLMQHSRILLHPSSYEGFSTACLEAIHAGARVVSFCKPMENEIPNWQTAEGLDDMISKTRILLLSEEKENIPDLPDIRSSNAIRLMRLFDYNEVAAASIWPAIALGERQESY